MGQRKTVFSHILRSVKIQFKDLIWTHSKIFIMSPNEF